MTLDPFPEVPEVLERLKRAGLRTSILSKYSHWPGCRRSLVFRESSGSARDGDRTCRHSSWYGAARYPTGCPAAQVNWIKIVLTYLVPYAVCTYGAVSYQLHRADSAGLPRQA
jgi:hypothetical protein